MVTLPPGASLGRYRIIEQLGRGGMATVFRAFDPNLDRHVAVKVLPSYETDDPTFTARFAHEAQTVAKLSHPNILQIYDFGEDKGFSYLVSELVGGGDLQQVMKGHPMPMDDVLRYLEPLAAALDYAHSQGIIHRDIKPANVLLTEQDHPILADFGLARMLESVSRFTLANQALGTPEYMAPEQGLGADADHRSDLYAFGIITFQMLLGETPYRADTPAATLMAHVHRPLPLPSALDQNIEPRVEACILKMLSKDPGDRFASAGEFVAALGNKPAPASAGVPSSSSTDDDPMATAVMDVSTEAMPNVPGDMPTAVVSSTAALTQPLGTPAQPGEVGPGALPLPDVSGGETQTPPSDTGAPPTGMPFSNKTLFMVLGAVALVAVLAIVGGVYAMSGGDDDPAPVAEIAGDNETVVDPDSSEALEQIVEVVDEPTPLPAANAVDALLKLVTKAESAVVDLRELGPADGSDPDFRTREELETITRGIFRRPDLRDRVFEAEQLYKVLGLMAEDEDLQDTLFDIQVQQVSALFDDEAEVVYVLTEVSSVGAKEELALAGAYMSLLLQDAFDVADMRATAALSDWDARRAVDALISGDVFQVIQGYVATHFDAGEIEELQVPIPDNKVLAAPTVVQKANQFLQREGAGFVASLFGATGSWASVDNAYANPPVSSEQVIHPDKYLLGEVPLSVEVNDYSPSLGKGWAQVSANTMGEWMIRTYLEEYLDEDRAAAAAAGWGGDAYSLLSGPEGKRILVAQIAWDSRDEAAEFFAAYQVFGGIKAQQLGGSSQPLDNASAWELPNQTVFLGLTGQAVLLIISEAPELMQGLLTLVFDDLTSGP
jgi:serine/threonine protein kinase